MCKHVENDHILQLYHEHWGHMNRHYVRVKFETELGIKVKFNDAICEPCQFRKAHCQPFGTRVRTASPGELLSGDVCGPFDVPFSGRKYLIIIKDHYSHFKFCFVSKEKSAIKDALH